MYVESLLVSASINIGLSLLILTTFSVLRRQPSNAPIYFARRLSQRHHVSFHRRFFPWRLLPSVEWISSALRVTEAEILDNCGLDVFVLIRLFKFGINFFMVCAVVGLLVLLPLNYKAGSKGSPKYSMDSFTISNITSGSNWLWVHFSCLYFLSCYGLYLLYKEYNNILHKRIHQLHCMRHAPNQFTVLVREIPICEEHGARDCCVDHFFSKYHPHTYQSYQILYDGRDLERQVKEAISISREIGDLKHQSKSRRIDREIFLSPSSKYDADIKHLKEILQELLHNIRRSQSRDFLQDKELPVAFVTFKSRWGAALAAQSQQDTDPLLWITEMAPEPRDVLWNNLAISYRFLPLRKFWIYVAASLLTIFFAVPVAAVQGIAKYEQLVKWFPPAMAIDLIPGLSSVVTGYLPSAILNCFVYAVPFAMIQMSNLAGYISRSKKDIKACNMVFYFLVANVFFLSLLSGSLLEQIGESFFHPKDFPSRLASAVSAQADFFMTYIFTNGLCWFSLEILQPGLLLLDFIKSHTWNRGKKKRPYLYSLPYYRIIPYISLCLLIGMVYAVVSPVLIPFLVGYFCLGYVVFINQIRDVYITTYETCGQYWPYIHQYILIAIVIMQITMIGLFGLKSKPAAAFATIPLLIFTLLFNEYCKMRFFPTFCHYSLKDAMELDELDENSGAMDANLQNATDAYCPPCLRPPDFEDVESGSSEPLISSR